MSNQQIAAIIAQEFEVDCSASSGGIWWVPPAGVSKEKFEALANQITNRVIELDTQTEATQP